MTPLRVLLVDDNIFNREGLRLYLQLAGFAVLEAGDAQAALELAERANVQAAVIDISIPPNAHTPSRVQHNYGNHLARQIKLTQPALGIVFFSAYEDRGGDGLDMIRSGVRGLAYKLKGCWSSQGLFQQALRRVFHWKESSYRAVRQFGHAVVTQPDLAQLPTPLWRRWCRIESGAGG